jgi:hypothetical protein
MASQARALSALVIDPPARRDDDGAKAFATLRGRTTGE